MVHLSENSANKGAEEYELDLNLLEMKENKNESAIKIFSRVLHVQEPTTTTTVEEHETLKSFDFHSTTVSISEISARKSGSTIFAVILSKRYKSF